MKTIQEISLTGKRVFIRVDFNVPLDADQRITDDTRIKAALPTITHALEQNARVLVASHLGRPEGQVMDRFSLSPVAKRLGELLGKPVRMAPDCIGPDVRTLVDGMAPGDIAVLENLRFHAEEQRNDVDFAKALAENCDVYINDAFAVCHRANASVVAMVPFVSERAAGLLLKQELDFFQRAMTHPKRPLVAIVGGAKVSSKLAALENMMHHVNKILIGGAMANTFLKGTGCEVGASKIEPDMIPMVESVMAKARKSDIRLYLPVDAVVAQRLAPDAPAKTVPVQEIPAEMMALDIGPATAQLFGSALHDAATVVWNGPMGVFEMDAFSGGTMELARRVAESGALSIVGGGDTDAAIHRAGVAGKIGYISTGGGAFLKLLEGKTLPAVAALDEG